MKIQYNLIFIILVWNFSSGEADFNIATTIKLTYNLTEAQHFHNFIIFYSNQDSTWTNLTKLLHEKFHIPTTTFNVNTFDDQKDQFQFSEDYNNNCLVFAIINPYEINNTQSLDSNLFLKSLNESLLGIHFVITFIIFDFPTGNGINDIDINSDFLEEISLNLFKRLWLCQFYRAAILISNSSDYKLLTYLPFPEVQLLDITNMNIANPLLFRKIFRNIHKQVFKTLVVDMAPRSMQITNKKGEKKFSGTYYYIVIHFIKYINGTFKNSKYYDNSPNISNSLRLLELKKIDITGHAIAINRIENFRKFNKKAIDNSYPYYLTSFCLMVPCSKEIPQYLYTYLPFNPFVWITLVCFILYITFVKIILLKISPTKDYAKFIGSAFNTSVCEVFFLPASRPKKYHLNFIQMFIIILPYSLGFILSNFYMTKLSSYLAISIFEPQINTIDDLLKSKLKILGAPIAKDVILYYPEYKVLEDIIVTADFEKRKQHQNKLNVSYAYVNDDDKIDFLLSQQKYAKRPIFRKSKICFQNAAVGFFIQMDSIYKETFHYFILRVRETGLQYAWEKKTYVDAYEGGVTELIYSDDSFLRRDLLRLSNVLGAFILLSCGHCLGFLMFLLEIFIYHWKKNFLIDLKTL